MNTRFGGVGEFEKCLREHRLPNLAAAEVPELPGGA